MSAIFIGVGGTGDWILTYLKDKLHASRGAIPKAIQFRLLDTLGPDNRLLTAARLGDKVGIANNEYVQLEDNPVGTLFKTSEAIAHNSTNNAIATRWYRADLFVKHLPQADFNLETGAGQHRQFGRMGVFLNRQRIRTMIQRALEQAPANGGEVAIWIVGSVAGGTGAGIFLDVAALARHVAEEMGIARRILGVAILPDVFMDQQIDLARAYAALRELERFQAPVDPSDQGRDARYGRNFRFAIDYDGEVRVFQTSRLFDNLVFYNQQSKTKSDRENYFSQIADGMNLLLDKTIGNQLFAQWLNVTEGHAASFNNRQVFLPARLYELQFMAKAMLEVTYGLLPRDGTGVILAGADDDRKNDAYDWLAKQNFRVFGVLLDLDLQSKVEQLDQELTPLFIVNTLLGFGNIKGVFTADNIDVGDSERYAKSIYKDLTAGIDTCKKLKEGFEDSKTRVKREVNRRRDVYKGDGGESCAAALDSIRVLLKTQLHDYIDNSLQDSIGGSFVQHQGLGRALRILQEAKLLLFKVQKNRLKVMGRDRNELERLTGDESDVLATLDTLKKPLFGYGKLAEVQDTYLEAVNATTRRWQRMQLGALLDELVQTAAARYDYWLGILGSWEITIGQVTKTKQDINTETEEELERQVRSTASYIGYDNTKDMGGYRTYLEELCLGHTARNTRISTELLQVLTWRLRPDLQQIVLEGWPGTDLVGSSTFSDKLQTYMAARVHTKMTHWEGMARYLAWLRDNNRSDAIKRIVEFLQGVSNGFVDGQQATATRRAVLLYGDHWSPDQLGGLNQFQELFNSVSGSPNLHNIENNLQDASGITLFQDRNVIAVLLTDTHIKYPNIPVIARMRGEYLRVRQDPTAAELWRVNTYHLFRCEQEIWAIERNRVSNTGSVDVPLTSGAYYRLLDEPDRVRSFAQALATGVIRQEAVGIDSTLWVCGAIGKERPIYLTTAEPSGADQDLFRALVTFVQDQKDRRPNTRGDLELRTVTAWVQDAVTASASTFPALVATFRQHHPELFALQEIQDEYADPRQAFIALILTHYLKP